MICVREGDTSDWLTIGDSFRDTRLIAASEDFGEITFATEEGDLTLGLSSPRDTPVPVVLSPNKISRDNDGGNKDNVRVILLERGFTEAEADQMLAQSGQRRALFGQIMMKLVQEHGGKLPPSAMPELEDKLSAIGQLVLWREIDGEVEDMQIFEWPSELSVDEEGNQIMVPRNEANALAFFEEKIEAYHAQERPETAEEGSAP